MLRSIKIILFVLPVLASALVDQKADNENDLASQFNITKNTCRLLANKLLAASPWSEFPVVYEPITKGHLTIWSGVSSLPSSEFFCMANRTLSTKFTIEFANFANRLEWTYFNAYNGDTLHGFALHTCDNSKFEITIRESNRHLECNSLEKIELLEGEKSSLKVICELCSPAQLHMIEAQLKDFTDTLLKDQIKEGLYWQMSQLLSNQHFSGPIAFE